MLEKANGVHEGILAAEKLQLSDNHFYYSLMGELYKNVDKGIAKGHFQSAIALAKTSGEKQTLQNKLEQL
ncbi:MAG: hypothetical protein ABIQ02_03225 [Saprospiraceae bacterium]